jgi:signal transduction histidine kinase
MKSIRFRFVALSLVGVTVALALAAWFFVTLFSANLSARIDTELTGHINRLAGTLTFSADGALQRPESPADNRFYLAYGGLYWQVEDLKTNTQMRSPSLFDYALPLPKDHYEPGKIDRYRLPGPNGTDVIVQERDVIVAAPGGARDLRLAVAIDATALDKATTDFAYAILPYMGALAIILASLSGFQIAWGLKPLSRLASAVKDVQERRAQRLEGAYPDELQPLVGEMNLLLDSQTRTIEKARTRASDLAHGLKTPLTILSNNALTLRERGDEDMARELDHLAETMLSHVNGELARSRIAPTAQQRRSDANLAETIHQVVRTLKKMPQGAELDWPLAIADNIVLPVDPHDLRELLGNIFENAVKWADSSIAATATRAADRWILVIEDDGPGVPDAKLASLTRRGLRLDHEKPGTGLGLAIVKEIAEVYSIGLTLENRKSGGLRATLSFPA